MGGRLNKHRPHKYIQISLYVTIFPLTGGHIGIDCNQCHIDGFPNTPTDCNECHNDDYTTTVNPNHNAIGISTDCVVCHTTEPGWMPAAFDNHNDFYQLNGAHAGIANDCAVCHNGDYNNTQNTCVGCHQSEYDNTTDPNHIGAQFPTDCIQCHTENAWTPATFDHDGQYFPINSGAHQGEWNACMECHTNPDNFSVFTCITCHTNPETDDEHDEVSGYVYESNACFACHPTGDAGDAFNHDATIFPLTGGHIGIDCNQCHIDGFPNTPTDCNECHNNDYTTTVNPNHNTVGISTDCIDCHTTEPGWMPAAFDIHNDYFQLNGAHAEIANDCASCHNGNYNNTANTCVGCHQSEYDNTTNPNHNSSQFSTDCIECHTEDDWIPANFDHDGQYFPIYSGQHEGEWIECIDCHTNPDNFAIFTCISCHINPETNEDHVGISGYIYEDNACLACHPTGDADEGFNHDATNFPLTGAHIGIDCSQCHTDGFPNTPTDCLECHNNNYEATANPNHNAIGISTDCVVCHTTEPGWMPASFDNHNDYYQLNGAHAGIANDCAACHNGDYNNTQNTCIGCHQIDYNNTTDPNHTGAQFPTDCMQCHSENAWTPANFDHDGQYFPIYSGEHQGEWNDCIECHTNPDNYSVFTCVTCHIESETNDDHDEVSGYVYESIACLDCHPNANKGVNRIMKRR